MTEPTSLISMSEASPNLTEPRSQAQRRTPVDRSCDGWRRCRGTTRQSCHCWSHRRGGRELSAHQGGGEPLRPMPLEITRCLHVPGAELAPPLVRRGLGRVVAVDTHWPIGQACHSCGIRRLVSAYGCRRHRRGRLHGRYPQHVLAPRPGASAGLARLAALAAVRRRRGPPFFLSSHCS
jgi:hypothetical protein